MQVKNWYDDRCVHFLLGEIKLVYNAFKRSLVYKCKNVLFNKKAMLTIIRQYFVDEFVYVRCAARFLNGEEKTYQNSIGAHLLGYVMITKENVVHFMHGRGKQQA